MANAPLKAKGPSASQSDMARILSLPIVGPITEGESEAISQLLIRPKYFKQGFRLLPRQAEALLAFEQFGRLAAPVGVGHGKTGIGLLCSQLAMERFGHVHCVLLQPPNTVPQLIKRDLPFWRQRVNLSMPVHSVHGKSPAARKRMARLRAPGLYVVPFSLLSARDAEDFFSALQPSFLAIDECHRLKDRSAARTKRILRYMSNFSPEMLIMSGTMTSKGVNDYAHLMNPCLQELSPLPHSYLDLMDWAEFLDASAGEPSQHNLWKVAPLVNWYLKEFPGVELEGNQSGIRRAFRTRLATSPAVVASADDEIGVSLNLDIIDPKPEGAPEPKGYARMLELMRQVDVSWQTPSGDEIDYAIHKWAYLHQLSAGIFHNLHWPDHPDKELLEASQHHHMLTQEYHKLLRNYLNNRSRPHLDTPMLVGSSFARHGNKRMGERELFEAWTEMKEAEKPGMVERLSDPVRVCDYKVVQAVEWAAELQDSGQGCILWYHHQAIGEWLAERTAAEGLRMLHCPAGPEHNIAVADPSNADHVVIASMRAHGEGKNLQHHRHALFVQAPRQAELAQQVLGRLHRTGQEADELTTYFSLHGDFDSMLMAAMLVEAVHQHTTIGNLQKVMGATWLSELEIFPSQFLQERGLVRKKLDQQEEAAYVAKFGRVV